MINTKTGEEDRKFNWEVDEACHICLSVKYARPKKRHGPRRKYITGRNYLVRCHDCETRYWAKDTELLNDLNQMTDEQVKVYALRHPLLVKIMTKRLRK